MTGQHRFVPWRPLTERWRDLREALFRPQVDEDRLRATLHEAREHVQLPVIWLIGKTQSGKTSIVRALTASPLARVGNGFQPCTATARIYDFPADTPVVRFLDTRGLGEVAYDPGEDIRFGESQAHLLLGVMKAGDADQEAVFSVLRAVRERHPEWPLVIAQTGLHELYPPARQQHHEPWPFASEQWPQSLPGELVQALRTQRHQLGRLPGDAPVRWVPVDLTLPEDGFTPVNYGLEPLWQAIDESSELRLRMLLHGSDEVGGAFARAAHPQIVGYALAATGVGALPLVDLTLVPALQAKLLHSLAVIYGQPWNRRLLRDFLALLGTGIGLNYAVRAGGRSLIKLVPGVGQSVGAVWGAVSSGATTYALGKTAAYFFNLHLTHGTVSAANIRRVFADEFEQGAALVRAQVARRDTATASAANDDGASEQ